MSLEALTGHLDALAEADNGLKKSRAMAQMWKDIRQASPKDRMLLAQAIANRFAPDLAESIATETGIEGPEFVKLVRSIIDLDTDDIRRIATDLASAGSWQPPPAPFVRIDTPDHTTPPQPNEPDPLYRTSPAPETNPARQPQSQTSWDYRPAPEQEPSPEQVWEQLAGTDPDNRPPTAFDTATQRLSGLTTKRYDPLPPLASTPTPPSAETPRDDDTADGLKPSGNDAASVPPVETSTPAPAPTASQPLSKPTSTALSDAVAATPDGWQRRRQISGIIRTQKPATADVIALAHLLAKPGDRAWIYGDLIAAGLTEQDRQLLDAQPMPAHLRRRLHRNT